MPRERAVGDRLVLERDPVGLLVEGVHVAEGDPAVVPPARARAASASSSTSKSRISTSRIASCLAVSSLRPVSSRWVGKTSRPGSDERAEQHQHVAVLALAADLVGVHARGLVAVMAVGDQQLGVGQRHLQLGDEVLVGRAPERVARAVEVGRRGERLGRRRSAPSPARRRPSRSGNRLKMGDRLVRVARVSWSRSSFGPGVGALVRADPAGPVLVHAHAREHAGAGAAPRRRARRSPGAAPRPPARPRARARRARCQSAIVAAACGVARRQVDLDDVVGAARGQPGAQLGVDDVVRRSDHVLERAHRGGLVPERAQRLQVGHRRRHPSARRSRPSGVASA